VNVASGLDKFIKITGKVNLRKNYECFNGFFTLNKVYLSQGQRIGIPTLISIVTAVAKGTCMKFKHSKRYLSTAIYCFLVICASIIFYHIVNRFDQIAGILDKVFAVLMPFIIGLALAFVINPMVKRVEHGLLWLYKKGQPTRQKLWQKMHLPQRKKPSNKNPQKKIVRASRLWAALISVLLTVLLIFGFLLLVIPQTMKSLTSLAPTVIRLFNTAVDFLNTFVEDHNLSEYISPQQIEIVMDTINGLADNLYVWLTQTLPPYLYNFSLALVKGLLNFVIGVIIAIYTLLEKERFIGQIKKMLYSLFRHDSVDKVFKLTHDSNRIFSGFIIGKIIDSMIIGVLCFFGMLLLKLPYALLISVVVGVTNIIPYFGPFIGAIPSILIILIDDPIKGLVFAIFILVLQQIDGNIIGPKILGDSTGLTAFWVIFAVTLGGGLFGVPGMIIGVPAFAVIYSWIRVWVNSRLDRKGLSTNTEEYLSDKQADYLP